MTPYRIAIDIALAVFGLGLLYRVSRWFWVSLGPEAQNRSPWIRFRQAVAAAGRMAAPATAARSLRGFLLEGLLQSHVAKDNFWRWGMHMALAWGTLALVVFHALDGLTSARIFGDYASTLNPYLFVRNALGALVLAGIIVALVRRRRLSALKAVTSRGDLAILLFLALIIGSGVALESTQIISARLFDDMVNDYMGSADAEEIAALRAYWADAFDIAFYEDPPITTDSDRMRRGESLHAEYCASCHSRPTSAFIAYPLAKTIKPLARRLEAIRAAELLWTLHAYAALAALALLPFTKFFHLLSTPLSLVVRAIGPAADNRADNRATRRALALDACTHCGVCSIQCRVAPCFRVMGNPVILPSEKLKAVARMALGRDTTAQRSALAEGSLVCTRCGTCTQVCPAGIDLQDLWAAADADLERTGFPDPFHWIRNLRADQWARRLSGGKAFPSHALGSLGLSNHPESFWACIQCSTCTSVCPVVAVSEDPQRDLDWSPQQVMNLMRLQLKDLALGSRMVWDCVTCYQCQEHCPQGVKVADVLYELRNEAYRRLKPDTASERDAT